ncbi:MAG: hypothetical protein HY835_07980 [Anaerolineae bacterium]|nr:hypothetical protein [Anaerolineae bacterium]
MTKPLPNPPEKRYHVEQSPDQMRITIPGYVSPRMRGVMLLSLPLWIFVLWILIDTLAKALPALLVNGSLGRWFSYLVIAAVTLVWIWHGMTLLRALLRRLGSREVVRLTPTEIEITHRTVWGETSERFATQDVRAVNLAKIELESLVVSRFGKTIFRVPVNGPVRFQLPDRSVTVGLDLEKEEAMQLISLLQAHLTHWKQSS